jgi:hypothetical protein
MRAFGNDRIIKVNPHPHPPPFEKGEGIKRKEGIKSLMKEWGKNSCLDKFAYTKSLNSDEQMCQNCSVGSCELQNRIQGG